MLPIIPIVVAVASAAALIHRKYKRDEKQYGFDRLVRYVKSKEIPLDSDGKFNPDTLLPNGKPLLFDVMEDAELLSCLLEYGANPNICDAKGVPAIIYASSKPDFEKNIAFLLNHGANPNAMDSWGKTAIFYARSDTALDLLYNAGADINAADCSGRTALMCAVSGGQGVDHLIALGADVNALDNNGKNSVFYATADWILQKLKEAGADFNVVDNTGKTPLFYSLETHTTEKLLECGANANARDRDGKTVFFYIRGKADFPIVRKLEKRGLNIRIADNNEQTDPYYELYKKYYKSSSSVLYKGVNENNINEVKLALSNGEDPNIWDPDVKNWSMVHLAIHRQNPEMIELLVNAGADINASNDGIPPLCKAVYNNNVPCFKKLLELGADPELAALAVKYCGSLEIKEIFIEYYKGDSL
ncbi:MAG: ankyrin repeat domain-containing protein [Proteobacteria bacterium]|nr:ankyrin repeat domain-containing protein [Pseudomonadota bacterium]